MPPSKRGSRKSPAVQHSRRRTDAPRRAVFLDRDGTICEEMGYMNHLRRFAILRNAPYAIRTLNDRGIPVIVVTNQSGVARGFFPEALVHEIHEMLRTRLSRFGARAEGIYFCPHIKADGCKCRKPLPGMLRRAAREHRIELRGSWVVSDRYADIEMAHRVGAHGALVLTGYGRGEYTWNRKKWPRQPEVVAEDLAEAVTAILRRW